MTPDDLHPHAGVLVPMDRVELDEASDDGLVEVRVLHGVRVRVTFEHLRTQVVLVSCHFQAMRHCHASYLLVIIHFTYPILIIIYKLVVMNLTHH